ncbi:carboxypeptidase-like regulatory domain-containing protein [uncultured Psychroserpens sp.]|uniref:carboxypeptidase-like regulatory domain-containing protein n=1 Tax=uncultured Psychroserpens sp. TaxID=255436 RepID=UPI00261479CC|nr:carboxypeptidase-like regulatory domain-containing protein [uncultured Psychroserpens sp.]
MKNQLLKKLCIGLVILVSANLFAQEGTVSGTINSEIDGLPLPGVSVIVKGTNRGVQTDFDGNYSIKCRVGETLVFKYIAMTTKEVKVTSSMLGLESNDFFVDEIPIKPIENDAYKNAIKTTSNTPFNVPSLDLSNKTYNKVNNYQYNRIKDIKVKENKVDLTYFDSDIYFEIKFNSKFGTQFFKDENLPKLQSVYAQGASLNGELAFLGAETGNPFSYGPKLSNLEFDGSTYDYDVNGQLVALGSGNGTVSNPYDNAVLQTTYKTDNTLSFSASTDGSILEFNYSNTLFKDVFNRERSVSDFMKISFNQSYRNSKKLSWEAYLKYGKNRDNQPNINGFLNNTLLNAWATPASFSNTQNPVLTNNTQRRFNANFNNPNWLLDNNRNAEKNKFFVAYLKNGIELSETINIHNSLSYTKNTDTQNFGLVTNSAGFDDGYSSDKTIEKNVFNAILDFEYESDDHKNEIKVISKLDFSSEDLTYNLHEGIGFNPFSFENPQTINTINNRLNRNTLQILNKFTYGLNYSDVEFTVGNNSYISSVQNNKWALPFLQLNADIERIFDIYGFTFFNIYALTSFDVNNASLFYNNQSHNSLGLLPSQSLSYTANNDLFLSDAIDLEEKRSYQFGVDFEFYLSHNYFRFDLGYFNTQTKGSVFPIFENNNYALKNIADVTNKGLEMSLHSRLRITDNFDYNSSFVFSTNNAKVTSINSDEERVPIAGFSSVSKNLIVGESAGVIVGSAYARDNQNNIIIDNEGFPLVANQPQIIGDPIPDFNFGIKQSFVWKDLELKVVLDIQKGGDVWNGTQNVLNYLGRSQQSANERTITNFIFSGVNQLGQQNTVPVDFYNPQNDISQNRFIRYGFSGVDEAAIQDGSYVNLKSIDLSYNFEFDNDHSTFIRELTLSLYANNLITWAKFDGASPYRSLYDTPSSLGLNFFNMPITSEIGFMLNIKI